MVPDVERAHLEAVQLRAGAGHGRRHLGFSRVVALVEAEGIEATEDELLEALADHVEPDRSGKTPDTGKLLATLRKNGRISELIENITARKAVDTVVAAATPAPPAPAPAE